MKRLIYIFLAVISLLTSTVYANNEPRHAPNMYVEWSSSQNFDAVEVDWLCDKDAVNTYWAVHNWSNGYAGFQNKDGKHVLLLSLWDLTDGTTPQIEYISHGENGDFDGEGTGKQVFTNYNWQVGKWYSMRIQIDKAGNKTIYSQWIKEENSNWLKIAAISYENHEFPFTGVSMFQEDFTHNNKMRSCKMRNARGRIYGTNNWNFLSRCEITNSFFPTDDATWEKGVLNNITYNCNWNTGYDYVWVQSGGQGFAANGKTIPAFYTLTETKDTKGSNESIKYDSGTTVSKTHTHNYNFNNGQCYCGAVKSSSQQNNAESTLKINLTSYPVRHTQGNNFGLRGTISSNYKIRKIYGYIKQNGNSVQSSEDTPNVKSVDVRYQHLNNNLIFDRLNTGDYTLEVQAIDASGNSVWVSKNFTVIGEAARAESTLSINLDRYPVTLNEGSSFGLRGSVSSNYDISVVRGYVINSNGQTVLSSKDSPYSRSLNIKYANLNNDLVFNNLSAGNYILRIAAADSSGRTVEVSKEFSVMSQQKGNSSSLSINLERYPVTLKLGSSFGLRGSVTSNYNISSVRGYVTNSNGQTVLSSKDTPNSTYMDIRYANLNEDLVFNNLSAGNYTMKVVAVDASGRTAEAAKDFTVKANEAYVDNSPNGDGVTGVVNIPSNWDNLSIRTGPSTNYQIVGSMNNGVRCTVYPNKTSNGWYYVNYNGIWGYASGRQINLSSSVSNTQAQNTRIGIVNIPSDWDNLSIRTGPSTGYQIVGSMNHGVRCTVYPDKASNGWYYVEYNGVRGYAAGNRINLQ